MKLKTFGVILVLVLEAWLGGALALYLIGPVRLSLFAFFAGANVYTVLGLLLLVLYKPPEIVIRFPRLYVSIIAYASSAGVFTYWYAFWETNSLFYLGGALSFVGTIVVMRGVRRVPKSTGAANASMRPPL